MKGRLTQAFFRPTVQLQGVQKGAGSSDSSVQGESSGNTGILEIICKDYPERTDILTLLTGKQLASQER